MGRVTTLVAIGVFVAAIASLLVGWSVFFTLWLHGETSITIYADQFGEFWIELVLLTLAVVFLPVLLYELSETISETIND